MLGPRPLSAEPGTLCQWLPETAFCAGVSAMVLHPVSGGLEYSTFD